MVSRITFAMVVSSLSCATFGCKNKTDEGDLAPCPSAAFVEALHAASFYFQHEDRDRALAHLAHAERKAHDLAVVMDVTGKAVLDRLRKLRTLSDPVEVAGEAEYVRVDLSGWRCLPDDLHRRLHAALPAID